MPLRNTVLRKIFAALLSPAALPYLEADGTGCKGRKRKTLWKWCQYVFDLYANYCENFVFIVDLLHNKINRAKLNAQEVREMAAVAKAGLQEVLILTGEKVKIFGCKYIGEACKIARKYFKVCNPVLRFIR